MTMAIKITPSPDVVYVDHFGYARRGAWPRSVAGADRLAEEGARIREIMARAVPPARCSAAIPVAPARGPQIAQVPREVVMTDSGPRVRRGDPELGNRVRLGDAFDRMEDQARRRHQAKTKGLERDGKPIPYRPLFTTGQVEIAREYAALTERCDATGVKCSSLEVLRASASGGGDREVAIFRDFQRLRYFHARIGDGLAKEVRRMRPGADKRRAIRARRLVDQVCLSGRTLSEVLEDHGWSVDAKSRTALRRALCSALDRMRGFDMARPQNVA
ncbi:hypothetical protein [Salipiger mucosus]|uniref:Uncharacterized protein n=1 Tax=Salipiger mucosus DSM 16094 TaxID=1123237 RepID=S9QKZ2_9RHOB|nr:hypothetical protein [Salipiger mucosus]EPX82086.1 hypothetical protein Salmuc_02453 [Salipiger mucosus DSM 16094]